MSKLAPERLVPLIVFVVLAVLPYSTLQLPGLVPSGTHSSNGRGQSIVPAGQTGCE